MMWLLRSIDHSLRASDAQGMAGRDPAGARELGADRERVDAEAHQIVDEQEQTADSGGKL